VTLGRSRRPPEAHPSRVAEATRPLLVLERVMIRAAVVVLVAILSSGCSVVGSPSETTPGTSSSAPSPTPAISGTAQPTATAASSSTPPSSQRSVAQVVTTDLVVRSAPGAGSESRIYQERLASPTLLYVFEGPVSADGYDWYLVLPRELSYLPDGHSVGWVAAAGKDGESWIGDATPHCPQPTVEEIVELSEVANLACFGSETLTLDGWIADCGARDQAIASPYIWTNRCIVGTLLGSNPDIQPSPGGLGIWFDGDIGAQPSAERRLSRITGHFDDSRSATCPTVIPADTYPAALQPMDFKPPPGWGVFECRTQFVAASAELISAP
jgi:hypothetical protein